MPAPTSAALLSQLVRHSPSARHSALSQHCLCALLPNHNRLLLLCNTVSALLCSTDISAGLFVRNLCDFRTVCTGASDWQRAYQSQSVSSCFSHPPISTLTPAFLSLVDLMEVQLAVCRRHCIFAPCTEKVGTFAPRSADKQGSDAQTAQNQPPACEKAQARRFSARESTRRRVQARDRNSASKVDGLAL